MDEERLAVGPKDTETKHSGKTGNAASALRGSVVLLVLSGPICFASGNVAASRGICYCIDW